MVHSSTEVARPNPNSDSSSTQLVGDNHTSDDAIGRGAQRATPPVAQSPTSLPLDNRSTSGDVLEASVLGAPVEQYDGPSVPLPPRPSIRDPQIPTAERISPETPGSNVHAQDLPSDLEYKDLGRNYQDVLVPRSTVQEPNQGQQQVQVEICPLI